MNEVLTAAEFKNKRQQTGSVTMVHDSVYYILIDLPTIRTFDFQMGLDHKLSNFSSNFYRDYLYQYSPTGSKFVFEDNFNGLTSINQAGYHVNAGFSVNIYTNIKGIVSNKKVAGSIIREYQFTAALVYGISNTISDFFFLISHLKLGRWLIEWIG